MVCALRGGLTTASLLVLLVSLAPACDTTVEVEALDTLEGVELTYERVDDVVIPRRADGEPLAMVQSGPRAQTFYLELGGATIQWGDWRQDNAHTNTSFIPGVATSQVPPFDHGPFGADRGAVIAAIVDGLRQDFAGYQVTVTTARPASGPYTMVVVGGRASHIGLQTGAIGLAPLDQGNWNQSDVTFVFSEEMAAYGYDARHIAWVIAHEVGHSVGLTHIVPQDDIMHPVAYHHALRWGEGPTSDGQGYQNDREVLSGVLAANAPPPPPAGCGHLVADQALSAGQSLSSCDGRFVLVMQGDGNLVLYQHGVGSLWASNTYGTSGQVAVMQADGNFVLYGAGNAALWDSGTWGNPGATLALQNDGNLVVYSAGGAPLWASNTCCR